MYSALLKLDSNDSCICDESVGILLKIAENILKSPKNPRIRTLQRSNAIVIRHIINVPGALECLEFMGFEQSMTSLILPMNDLLRNLELMKNELIKRKLNLKIMSAKNCDSKIVKTENEVFKRVVLPPLLHMFSNIFLRSMENRFRKVLQHEDKNLQFKALSLLPMKHMEFMAQNKMRLFQKNIKESGKIEVISNEMEIQDFMILELLNWFKYEFFDWVDCLDCENCGAQTENATCSDQNLTPYAERTELHKCLDCGHVTYFARFDDLNILLETRRGRCGEWTNTFMLFCRALGWDTRIVYDESDHVWNEIYSHGQNRWLHCDPCEAAVDTPLVYETGWGKKITYVIAYSFEEVQDVTWRYTSQHSNVLKQRLSCSENDLVDAMMRLRVERQGTLSVVRRNYLTKRCLAELLEMMVERHTSDNDKQGRISGSVGWKLSRNEIRVPNDVPYIWNITENLLKAMMLIFKYSASKDKYELITDNSKVVKTKWYSGIFTTEGIFRKEEDDWRMVYISNKEDSTHGFITWKFNIADTNYVFDDVYIKLGYKLFEEGKISIKLSSSVQSVTIQPNELSNYRKLFYGETSITMTVTIVGGKSWQHAQLFRQTMDDEEYPFTIQFTFMKK